MLYTKLVTWCRLRNVSRKHKTTDNYLYICICIDNYLFSYTCTDITLFIFSKKFDTLITNTIYITCRPKYYSIIHYENIYIIWKSICYCLHLFIIYENGSNHMICVTRVSISHSFIMTRLRHNSVQLHIKTFDMGNDICLNVHVGAYQYIPFRLNDHLVSLCLTNIFEVTELNNCISVNTHICSYLWILFTLVRIVISLSLHIFILVNSRTVYLSHERYHKTVTCNRLYNTITIVSNHLRLPFNIMLLNIYYVVLELYNRKYFNLILYIDIDCLL